MARELKIEEFDLTEEEFYTYTKDVPKLHTEEVDGKIEYELFGATMSDPMKYKNYRKEVDGKEVDAFCAVQTIPQEMTCGTCHIKINTDKHNECPICKTTFREMIITNRKYNDGIAEKRAEMGKEFQESYTEWLKEWSEECGVDPQDFAGQ